MRPTSNRPTSNRTRSSLVSRFLLLLLLLLRNCEACSPRAVWDHTPAISPVVTLSTLMSNMHPASCILQLGGLAYSIDPVHDVLSGATHGFSGCGGTSTLSCISQTVHPHAGVGLPTRSGLSKPPVRYLSRRSIHPFSFIYMFPLPGFKSPQLAVPPVAAHPGANPPQPHLIHLVQDFPQSAAHFILADPVCENPPERSNRSFRCMPLHLSLCHACHGLWTHMCDTHADRHSLLTSALRVFPPCSRSLRSCRWLPTTRPPTTATSQPPSLHSRCGSGTLQRTPVAAAAARQCAACYWSRVHARLPTAF